MPDPAFTESYHKASTSMRANGFFMVKTSIVLGAADGTGSVTLYGPSYPANVTTPITAETSTATKRPTYRLAVYKLTGTDNSAAAGTRTAMLITFKTTGTGTGIIGRHVAAKDITATAGWVAQDAVRNTPLVVGDPGEGVTIAVAAGGDDGSIPCEVVCKLVPVLTPKPVIAPN